MSSQGSRVTRSLPRAEWLKPPFLIVVRPLLLDKGADPCAQIVERLEARKPSRRPWVLLQCRECEGVTTSAQEHEGQSIPDIVCDPVVSERRTPHAASSVSRGLMSTISIWASSRVRFLSHTLPSILLASASLSGAA